MSNATRRSYTGPALLIGGGLAAIGGAFFAFKKSSTTVENIAKAIAGQDPPATVQPPEEGTGGMVKIRVTGYWPFSARDDEKTMEGGVYGAAAWHGKRVVDPGTGKRAYLVTVEQHLADPTRYPYVSLSGDPDVWPWGQKILIPWTNGRTVTGRVVDTGGHFTGMSKIYRITGVEPLDICVQSSKTEVPKPPTVTAKIVAGDNWEGGRAVAAAGLKGQTVAGDAVVTNFTPYGAPMMSATGTANAAPAAASAAAVAPGASPVPVTVDERAPDAEQYAFISPDDQVTAAILEGRTTDDYESLARAVESELGGRPRDEQIVAGWAIRNRADVLGCSIRDVLTPKGEFGSASKSGGFASTRRAPTDKSREVAHAVLGAAANADPTRGAIDFWVPSQQEKLNQLGDVYRAAKASGDAKRMKKYAKYAGYCTEGEARVRQSREGLRPTDVVGCVELLSRR